MEPQLPLHHSTTTTPRSSTLRLVQRLTLTIFVSLFLILMIVIAIAWLVLDPHEPRVRVSSLSVSNFSVSDSELGGMYEVELNITNPNKKVQVMVERFSVSVCYGSVGLSRADVMRPIYLEQTSDEVVKVKLSLRDSPTKLAHKVVSQSQSHDLVKDWNRGIVNFDVKMTARIEFKARIWPSREKLLDIYCGNLDVGFVPIKNTGKLLGVGKDCHAGS